MITKRILCDTMLALLLMPDASVDALPEIEAALMTLACTLGELCAAACHCGTVQGAFTGPQYDLRDMFYNAPSIFR
jgi:hypothetical protein